MDTEDGGGGEPETEYARFATRSDHDASDIVFSDLLPPVYTPLYRYVQPWAALGGGTELMRGATLHLHVPYPRVRRLLQ